MKTKKRLLLMLHKKDPYSISSEDIDVKKIDDFKTFMQSESQIPLTEIDKNNDAFVFSDEQSYLLAVAVWENFFK